MSACTKFGHLLCFKDEITSMLLSQNKEKEKEIIITFVCRDGINNLSLLGAKP